MGINYDQCIEKNSATLSLKIVWLSVCRLKLGVRCESEVAQSCPTFCDPVDCSPPCSSVHGILQARILEWVAISFSRGSSRPRSLALQADALTSEPPWKPTRESGVRVHERKGLGTMNNPQKEWHLPMD